MRKTLMLVIIFGAFFFSSKAQIIVNGKNTYRPYFNNAQSSISLSYGVLVWVDAKQKSLNGYSVTREAFHNDSFTNSLKKFNVNHSLRFGFEKGITDKISIKTHVLSGKLITGASLRSDLSVVEKSNIFQLSTYGNLILSRANKKFKVHYMFGPEFMLVNKDVLIAEYVEEAGDTPNDYHEKETIFEVGLTTGLGFSYNFSKHLGIFTDGLIGISLPGGGFKLTSSGLGVKYIF